jgi:hypothetical protein
MAVDLKPLLLYLDFTKSPAEIIVELINYCNGTSLTVDMLTFSQPPTAMVGVHNTMVEASSTSNSYHNGTVEITYNRIDYEDYFADKDLYLIAEAGASWISDLIPTINEKYKLNLTRDDYIDAPLPDSDEAGVMGASFVLKANPRSLIFIGQIGMRVTNNQTTPAIEHDTALRTYTFTNAMPLRIKHNMNSVDFIESIRGVDNRRIFANIVVIDEMEFLVEFTEPESGKITVAFGVNN